MKRPHLTYLLILTFVVLFAAGAYALESHAFTRAEQLTGLSTLAGKGNKGGALHAANVAANYAETLRYWGAISLTIAAAIALPGIVEYVLLQLMGFSRVGAIARVTYYEAIFQPFTIIVFILCVAAIVITSFVPFNTFGEDTKMFRDVALSFALMFSLIIMVFATGKVVDEEIEDRTMLTLMSKPIARWQVVLGKYAGIVLLILVVLGIATMTAALGSYLRFFSDKRIDIAVSGAHGKALLFWDNLRGVIALLPAFVLQFGELCTLAAISIAIATRYSLALNMTVIVLLYIGANLTRFVPLLHLGQPWQGLAVSASYLLPYLSNFDLNQCLVYRPFTVGQHYVKGGPTLSQIWQYVGLACVYSVLYIGGALGVAMAMFRNRELT